MHSTPACFSAYTGLRAAVIITRRQGVGTGFPGNEIGPPYERTAVGYGEVCDSLLVWLIRRQDTTTLVEGTRGRKFVLRLMCRIMETNNWLKLSRYTICIGCFSPKSVGESWVPPRPKKSERRKRTWPQTSELLLSQHTRRDAVVAAAHPSQGLLAQRTLLHDARPGTVCLGDASPGLFRRYVL